MIYYICGNVVFYSFKIHEHSFLLEVDFFNHVFLLFQSNGMVGFVPRTRNIYHKMKSNKSIDC